MSLLSFHLSALDVFFYLKRTGPSGSYIRPEKLTGKYETIYYLKFRFKFGLRLGPKILISWQVQWI